MPTDYTHNVEDRLKVRLREGGKWSPLPDFMRWFVNLGRLVNEAHQEGERRLITMAVPSRDYVAAFLALGVLDSAIAAARHPVFQLEAETVVRFWSQDGTYQVGTFIGQETRSVLGVSRDYVTIRLRGQQIIHLPSNLAKVEPIDVENAKPSGFNGIDPPEWFRLVRCCFPFPDLTSRLSTIRNVAAIVGSKSAITSELMRLDLHLHGDALPLDMSSLIFAKPRPPFECEVQVLSAISEQDATEKPRVVILDGERAVYNYKLHEHDHSAIAILEPTSGGFDSAVSNIQGRLQFARPDHDWPALAAVEAPPLEWTCHLI